MGAAPSTPRRGLQPPEAAEFLIGALVGDKPYPVTSDFWQKLIEVPLILQWPQHRVLRACELFAQNNFYTHHLAKILIHLVWSLEESVSPATCSTIVYSKAINAAYMSSTFLKYLIEKAKVNNFENFYLTIDEGEARPKILPRDETISMFVMRGVLTFICTSEVSPQSCLLHHKLLNFMLVAMPTQLCSAPTTGQGDVHPFIDAAMIQENALICSVVRRLLVNYITRPHISFNGSSYPIFSEEMHPGVLQRFGSAAANFVLLPYYTFNYLISSTAEGSRSLLADNSLLVLLILIHYRKCVLEDEPVDSYTKVDAASYIPSKENSYFSDNPYCKALENARDIEFDRLDVEGNAQSGPLVLV